MDARAPAAPGRTQRFARQREEARATANTRRVRRLRVALPAVGGALAIGLLVAAVLPKLFPLGALAGLSLTADGLVMNAPRLAGHLGEGRRYEVVAERAVQSLFTPSRLSLERLDADLDMGEGERVTMHADAAVYDTGTEVLDLATGVAIASTDGNEARLDAATVDLKEGTVRSQEGVDITSPRGTIHAGRVDILDGGALIRFSGGVSITILPAS
ncbi:LPS export ABC transporter periplasmic protein LptC [Acuticoccus sp.]|uniref:LPS export ABC transporter periplasmic protein LptC n=1 Tax=Acuticoccus sp. TaxID=1904378 RepID=UPI003B51AF79